jgi:methionyl-tRNA formyltransferase
MNKKTYKTLFFGTPDFAVPVLEELAAMPDIELSGVFTQPDKPVGRKQTLTPPPVKVCAEKNHLPVFQPDKVKTKEFEEQLQKLSPDVCIVVAYGKIIAKNVLPIPTHGWLNVHGSLLPKYRGASPIQAAILNGETKTGVTLMQIDAGLDTGPILATKKITIEPTDTFQTLHDKLSQLGAEIVKESLPTYLAGTIKPQAQNNNQASETKIISKEDGKIDWNRSATEIERQIRAYTPWPGAFCFWNGKRLKIISATLANGPSELQPGQTKITGSTLIVGCTNGNLALQTIQLEGKKPQSSGEFLKGYPEFKQTHLS